MFDTALEYAQVGDIHFALRPGFIVQRTDGATARVLKTEGFGRSFVACVEWPADDSVELVRYGFDGSVLGLQAGQQLEGVWRPN